LLPLTGTFVSSGSVPFIRDVTVTERVHQSYTMVTVSKPYLTHDTLASPSVDSSPMSSLSNMSKSVCLTVCLTHCTQCACVHTAPSPWFAGLRRSLQGCGRRPCAQRNFIFPSRTGALVGPPCKPRVLRRTICHGERVRT
jgi:hypothetical protein